MISQPTNFVPRITLILLLSGLLGACSSTPDRRAAASGHTSGVGAHAAAIALEQLGVPYRYGGQSPTGFDCSGLIHYAYLRAGKSVPRTTGQLWNSTANVSRSEMRVGDLLFFSIDGKMQHVGMYIGEGQFVHAPSSGKVVSVGSLSSSYYQRALLRAGRPR